jgi:hypothetical protein
VVANNQRNRLSPSSRLDVTKPGSGGLYVGSEEWKAEERALNLPSSTSQHHHFSPEDGNNKFL